MITDPDELRAVYRDMESYTGFIAFDTEASGPLTEWVKIKKNRFVWDITGKMSGFSFAYRDRAYYVPVDHAGPNMMADVMKGFLRAFFALPNPIWAHHYDYDARIIYNYMGEYLWPKNMGDSMILVWLVGAGIREIQGGKEVYYHGLKDLTKHYFNHTMMTYEECVADAKVLVGGPTYEEIDLALDAYKDELLRSRKPGSKLPVGELGPMERKRVIKRRRDIEKTRVYRPAQMNDLTGEHVCGYGKEDAFWTLQLAIRFWPKVKEMHYEKMWNELEMPLLKVVREMHDVGVRIDEGMLDDFRSANIAEIEKMANDFKGLTGADITSSRQCSEALYDRMKLFPREGAPLTEKGVPKVDYDALQWAKHKTKGNELAQRIIDMKLAHAAINKLVTTYTQSLTQQIKYSPDGRIHPRFNSIGTRTGRFSSSQPNFQNLPRPSDGLPDIRCAVIPRDGYVMAAADLSQIEIIFAAHYSKDAALTEVLLEGKSMHDLTAEKLGVERHVAKVVNFSLQYGAGAKNLAKQLFMPLLKKFDKYGEPVYDAKGNHVEVAPPLAQEYYEKYHELYSGIKAFRDDMSDFAARTGYVETIFGRRRWVPEVKKYREEVARLDKEIQQARYRRDSARVEVLQERRKAAQIQLFHAERVCGNTPLQGGVADVMKKAMVDVHAYVSSMNPRGYIIAQVHDEILLELPASNASQMLDKVTEIMQTSCKLSFPIGVSAKMGRNWSECK